VRDRRKIGKDLSIAKTSKFNRNSTAANANRSVIYSNNIFISFTMISLRSLIFFLIVAVVAAGSNKEGLAFLLKKEKEDGVTKMSTGLIYKELTKGTGKTPTADSPCACHYSGTLIDGTEFDSSYKRGQPTTFAPNQFIKGWTEAMQLMQEGGKWELYIPSELAYGDRGAGGRIPGGAVLIFILELIEVKGDHVQ
jgi:FKBP-type peptidyl-prolyl cis-trans isomerase FklB